MEPGFVQAPGFGIQYSRSYVYTLGGQKRGPAAGNLRIGVMAGDDDPTDTGGKDGMAARWSASLVITRLQRYIEIGASGGLTCRSQSLHFGMRQACPAMVTPAHHLAVFDHHRAYHGIG
jgi:hypothetical protein